jgi:hypothetical protein
MTPKKKLHLNNNIIAIFHNTMFSVCVRGMVLVRCAGRAYAEDYSCADSAHVGERRQSVAVGLGVSCHNPHPSRPTPHPVSCEPATRVRKKYANTLDAVAYR